MKKKRIFITIALLALALLALFPAATFAQEDEVSADYIERLESLYGRLQEVSTRGEERLNQAREVVNKVNERLVELQAEGSNTSTVEVALAAFETAIDEAEAAKDAGDAILEARAGFDDDGNVTDPQLASETLRAVKDEFRNGRSTLREAARNLRHAIRDLRRDHRGDS